ncbi:MAG: ABC transporter family substrate-binding protein [Jatrophihabitans sp.]|uniref:ABC transporter family substrate-binding protein n=1 Tax=Jatrophihabitans sp. TaxID=1932789 RepID=UPI0039164F7E
MRVHRGKAVLAGVAALALALTACSSSKSGSSKKTKGGSASSSASTSGGSGTKGSGAFKDCGASPNTCNSGQTKPGGTVTYTIEKTISGWNINTAASNTFDYAEALDGVLPNVFIATPDLKPSLNKNLMISAEQTKASPQTLVYKVKPNAVWSDGSPIGLDDFVYAWYSQNAKLCPNCGSATTAGYDQIASITGADNGKTVTVVMSKPYADWRYMFGPFYPGHIAAQHGFDKTPKGTAASMKWFDLNRPAFSAGPYLVTGYVKDTSITETPNPKWYGSPKPALDKLIFRIIQEQTQEVPALQNNEVQAIYPQPNADLVQRANSIQGVQTWLGKGLQWEHLDLNTKNPFLSDKALRTAIFTAISRDDIIKRTVGQFVPGISPLNNHMLLPGIAGYTDNVTASGQGSGNIAKAKSILTGAGYTGVGSNLKTKDGRTVTFRCTYSAGNQLRQQTCQIIQNQLKKLGLNLQLKTTPDLSILDKHDFDMVIFAWVNSPFVTQGAFQSFYSKSASNYTQNVDLKSDALIDQAGSETDQTKVPNLLNQADVLINADAVSLPLFQKPTFMAARSNVANIRDDPTSTGPPYNVEAWGLKG